MKEFARPLVPRPTGAGKYVRIREHISSSGYAPTRLLVKGREAWDFVAKLPVPNRAEGV